MIFHIRHVRGDLRVKTWIQWFHTPLCLFLKTGHAGKQQSQPIELTCQKSFKKKWTKKNFKTNCSLGVATLIFLRFIFVLKLCVYLCICTCLSAVMSGFQERALDHPGLGMCESPRIGVVGKGSTHDLNHVTVSPNSITRLPSLHGKIPNERKQTLQNTTYLTRSNQSVLAFSKWNLPLPTISSGRPYCRAGKGCSECPWSHNWS